MGFFADKFKSFFSGSSSAQPTQSQVNQASDQIEGMVENRDLLQDKAPVQVNSKFSDFLERNKRADPRSGGTFTRSTDCMHWRRVKCHGLILSFSR